MSNKESWHPPPPGPGPQQQPGPPPPQSMEPQPQQGPGGPAPPTGQQQHRPINYPPGQQPVPGLPPPGMSSGGPSGFYASQQHQLPLPGMSQPGHPPYAPLPGMQQGAPSHGAPSSQQAPGPPLPPQQQQPQAQPQGPPPGPPSHAGMPQPGSGQPMGMPPGPPGGIPPGQMPPQQNGPPPPQPPPPTTGPHMLSALNPQNGPSGPQNLTASLQHSPIVTNAQQQQGAQASVNGPGGPILNVGHLSHSPNISQPLSSNSAAAASLSSLSTHHLYDGPPFSGAPVKVEMEAAAAATAGHFSGMHGTYRPLNVKDALSYLDQVKLQFADQPDVYNKFLDIMKDFKSQAIDTPGVIERVSSLFSGHPDLIRGFNTFLPPGYVIECSDDPRDTSIRVTTPQGITQATVGQGPPLGAMIAREQGMPHARFFEQQGRPWGNEGMYAPRYTGGPAPVQQPEPLSARHLQQQQRLYDDRQAADAHAAQVAQAAQAGASQLQNAAAVTNGNGRSGPSSLGPGGPGGMEPKTGKTPVEFNHAISYVNKIKNRFSQQPEIYKNFLEILQTYQRESKPIQDVYSQVTQLFSSAPDLLEDFKQFLPEPAAAAQAKAQAARAAAGDVAMGNGPMGGPGGAGSSRLPPVGNFAPPPSGVKEPKKKRGQPTAPEPLPREPQPPVSLGLSALRGGPNANKRTKTSHLHTKPASEAPQVSPTLTPYQPEPLGPPQKQPASQDELAFFDRVKKFIGNKQTYNEFLKLLNLFSQDLVDKNMMVTKVENFIGGNKELMEWFKRFVDYEGRDEVINNVPRNVNKVRLSVCRGLGPSYRLLPKLETTKQCSGRDDMCWEVLNDQWASHPTWASEDSGFVAHRKNQYEDTLHRIEEERHDYDFNIEANLRTIQLLEPIAQRISSMAPEERANFRLQQGLGGQSQTIYKRIIKKIYGAEHGNQIIDSLHTTPATSVPVVLRRLKQKDEEWKLAQREWNKVWRETTARVFWKSLDHQGITIKANDKKTWGQKALIAEIATKYKEQFNKRVTPTAPYPDYQFQFALEDLGVVLDACRLLAISLEHSTMVSIHDREKVDGFIKSFIPLFFGMSTKDVEDKLANISRRTPEEETEEFPSALGEGPSVRTRRSKREDDNLLRDVLKRGKTSKGGRKEKEGSVLSASKESTPEIGSVADEDTPMEGSNLEVLGKESDAIETWIKSPGPQRPGMAPGTPMDVEEPAIPRKRTTFTLFCNNTIYVFLRTFQILCGRLLDIKACEAEVAQDVQNRKGAHVARDLGILISTPETYFRDTSPTANYYRQVVEHCEAFVQGDLDAQTFEEGLRQVYVKKGWQLYTIDKLLAAILKLMQGIVSSDNKERNGDILLLFQKDRMRRELVEGRRDFMALIDYRMKVEEMIVGDDPLYRFEWSEQTLEMTIQHLGRGQPTINDAITREQQWNYYIQSYTMVTPTEGVNMESENYKAPFLKRNLRDIASSSSSAGSNSGGASAIPPVDVNVAPPSELGPSGVRTPRELSATSPANTSSTTTITSTLVNNNNTPSSQAVGGLPQGADGCVVAKHNLELKVCVNTYKVFYTQGTEDYMLGKGWFARRDEKRERAKKLRRTKKWKVWLEEGNNWVKEAGAEAESAKRKWRDWVGVVAKGVVKGEEGDREEGDVEMVG